MALKQYVVPTASLIETGVPKGGAVSLATLTASLPAGNYTLVVGDDAVSEVIVGGAPVNVVVPSLEGDLYVSGTVTVDPGVWTGEAPITYSYQWRRNGVDIPSETGSDYVPGVADDQTQLTCAVTATNAKGSTVAVSQSALITIAPPVAAGNLADLLLQEGGGGQVVDAAADFSVIGDPDLDGVEWEVSGTEVSIDAAGQVTVGATTLRTVSKVTVTATNSGGSAISEFFVTVADLAAGVGGIWDDSTVWDDGTIWSDA